MTKPWHDINAIYQIYPRSFSDSDSNGVGDLQGIIRRLDYIKGGEASLGIDAIWLSPIFTSPMADMGYDVSDYCDVDPMFGSIADLTSLIDEAHKREIKVMLDFVPNHTSIEHEWFKRSRGDKKGKYTDFYVWRDAQADGSLPNNWQSIFGGPAWTWDEERGQYYLHTFLKEQPDLNWDNLLVREEMRQVIRFWLDMGVDGIRADAVRWISKDPELRDDPLNPSWEGSADDVNQFDSVIHTYSRYSDNLFPYLSELTDVVEEYPGRIMIFEDYPDDNFSTRDQYLGFYSINPRVSMPFNFEGLGAPFGAAPYRSFITEFQGMLNPAEHQPVYCFSNHDQPRLVSRLGGEEQARLVALMQLTLPGLPTIYYGDEIGLLNTPVTHDQIRDISAFRSNDDSVSRDPSRTPMQWDDTKYAGFSTVKPWLPIGNSVASKNVASQQDEPDSFFALYRRLLWLRHRHDILRTGSYETFGEADERVFAFARRKNDEHVYVALNFSDSSATIKLAHGGRVLCCTHPVDYPEISNDGVVHLRPYEGALIECGKHHLKD